MAELKNLQFSIAFSVNGNQDDIDSLEQDLNSGTGEIFDDVLNSLEDDYNLNYQVDPVVSNVVVSDVVITLVPDSDSSNSDSSSSVAPATAPAD